MNEKIVYLDNNATTPIDPRVLEEMLPFLRDRYANISSLYRFAQETKKYVEEARERVARLINASSTHEIIFTSGGSESNNMALKGTFYSKKEKGKHIITSSIEHPSVLNTCKFLEKLGAEITYLPVDKYGLVDPLELKRAIRDDTILVSIMMANNEIGTIEPIRELAEVAHEKGVLFHTDAVQSVGKIKVDVKELDVDMLSLSAHKFYGPKGIGVLYLKRGVKIYPLIHGGHQELNRRAGTENVPGIVGLGKAAQIALDEMDEEREKITRLRDKLEQGLRNSIPEIIFNGHPEKRLYNTTNICVKYIEGEGMLINLDFEGICVSSGSACSSGSLEPSHVLLAIGLPHEIAHGSLRISLGKFNTEEDIDALLKALPPIVERLRELSPFWKERNKDERL